MSIEAEALTSGLRPLAEGGTTRRDWTVEEVEALFELPFNDLLFRAQGVHRANFDPNRVQISSLKSIKTGACPEDCKYCPQSAHYKTGVGREKLLGLEDVLSAARRAKAAGASRFCMGAAWRGPSDRDLAGVVDMIRGVRALGLETCASFGLLGPGQAEALRDAGLDFYNHNIDTSERFYGAIITTRTFRDRLETLERVRAAGIRVCCGGIAGLGESREDRAEMLCTLASFRPHPESVPINRLIPIPGTPLESNAAPDPFEFVRMIAVARILMPKSVVRLSAGREGMSDEMQALCFFAGANSIFYGEKLLTAKNPAPQHDRELFTRLGLKPAEPLL